MRCPFVVQFLSRYRSIRATPTWALAHGPHTALANVSRRLVLCDSLLNGTRNYYNRAGLKPASTLLGSQERKAAQHNMDREHAGTKKKKKQCILCLFLGCRGRPATANFINIRRAGKLRDKTGTPGICRPFTLNMEHWDTVWECVGIRGYLVNISILLVEWIFWGFFWKSWLNFMNIICLFQR